MVEDRLLCRNDIFDNKNNKEMVPGPDQIKEAPEPSEESSCLLIGQQ
jgi:hypothetical protein